MSAHGVVRSWSEVEGWGVIDSPQTPGGCWAHFSVIAAQDYQTLEPGQSVELEWEQAEQDGYTYRAVQVWVKRKKSSEHHPLPDSGSNAYSSTLVITWDDPEGPR